MIGTTNLSISFSVGIDLNGRKGALSDDRTEQNQRLLLSNVVLPGIYCGLALRYAINSLLVQFWPFARELAG